MHSAVVVALLLAPAAEVPVIAPHQARSHVGEEVVVRGQMLQLGTSENSDTLFLNFGGQYPDHVFNAVIFKRDFQHFPEARSWEFKTIEVRGKIQLYKGKGKPEIILERQEQVTVDSGTTPPQGAVPQGLGKGVEGSVVGGVPTGTAPVMDFDQPPRAITITRPQYPMEAFIKKVEGTVIVEILIDATGRVVRARIIQSVPLLDAMARETVYQWFFVPAVKNGRPVPTLAHAPITFRIYEKAPKPLEQRKQSPTTSGKK
jgi:TonB family protein